MLGDLERDWKRALLDVVYDGNHYRVLSPPPNEMVELELKTPSLLLVSDRPDLNWH